MARPNKQGLDYFPLDVHMDDKFKFIEIKYKLEGFAILIKLLQKIYATGYWYKWTEDELLLFSDELRTDFDLVNNVVNEAIKRGIFDKELHEKYQILTSKGIQKRYQEIVRRRKDVEVTEEYTLIDGTFGVNDDINVINANKGKSLGGHGDSKSTQSKVNRKETERKRESKEDNTPDGERNIEEDADESRKPKTVYDDTSPYFILSKFFLEQIRKLKPNFRKPNLQTWSDDFRKLVEIDGRTPKEIQDLILWIQKDDFWCINILSPSKLRKQLDKIELQMAKSNSNWNKPSENKNIDWSKV